MRNMRVSHSMGGVRIILVAVLLANTAWAASTTKLIYSFAGGKDGEYTDTELVMDKAGNLYGSSVQGGKYGSGTVFRVTPAGKHTVLYSFRGGADGGEPYKGVTLDAEGNLYGTAVTGGGGSCEGGCGVVYKVSHSGGTWTQSVIHTFTGNDGSGPGAPVAFDQKGNLYGMAPTGGALGYGVVFKMSADSSGKWHFKVIHTFTGGVDGLGGSAGRLLIDTAGNVFGVSTVGGANGFGNVFEISLVQGKWQLTTLYSFQDQPDGASPYGGLVFDQAGNLYGTTYYAGANDLGSVYKLTPNNGSWTETVIYSFKGGLDGDSPISTLVADTKGNLYGTTSDGGNAGCSCGTVFKLTSASNGTWIERPIYRFKGVPNPGFAYNGLVSDSKGNFYGATVHGGTTNNGAIYELMP